MSLPVVAPGEQVIELMIPASKVGLIIGKTSTHFSHPSKEEFSSYILFLATSTCQIKITMTCHLAFGLKLTVISYLGTFVKTGLF